MRIIERDDPVTLARLIRPDPLRSPGLHLSTIIGDMFRRLEPKRFGGPLSPERIALGLAIEEVIGEAVSRLFGTGIRPGEVTSDGIIMTPDHLSFEHGLEEWKATWVSDRDGLVNPKLDRYHVQGKAYARAFGEHTMLFRVFFVNGNYGPPAPGLRAFHVRYTKRELDENWDLVLRHAEDAGLRNGGNG